MAGSQSPTEINGKIHDWSDVKITIMGVDTLGVGITSINWSARKDKSLQYAAGSEPHGIGYGHCSYSADFTMTLDNAEKFEAVAHAANKDARDYAPFEITIAYADKEADGGLIKHKWGILHTTVLSHVDITDISESLDEGTQKIVRRYSAVVGNVTHIM